MYFEVTENNFSLKLNSNSKRRDLIQYLNAIGIRVDIQPNGLLVLPTIYNENGQMWNIKVALKRLNILDVEEDDYATKEKYEAIIDFSDVEKKSQMFIKHFTKNWDRICEILTCYETYQVACDEYERCKDLFSSLHENKEYFQYRIGDVATFLPRNQPFYALSCFALVPSMQASQIHTRAPLAMHNIFTRLCKELELKLYFPNVNISFEERQTFVDKRLALRKKHNTCKLEPVTEAVIFTGTMENANKLRKQFHINTLFISNGSGHNPIVIDKNADIHKAVKACLRVQLYNQGQDCASPSAILVDGEIYNEFIQELLREIKTVKVGSYKDPDVTVGPITEIEDIERVQRLFIKNSRWLHDSTPGVINTKLKIVYPTIICKPLSEGGNYI